MALSGLPPAACRHMDMLIDLLSRFPTGQSDQAVRAMIEQLDMLEYEARWQGASPVTLSAIQGAKVFLDVSELQPRRMRALSSPHDRRRVIGAKH